MISASVLLHQGGDFYTLLDLTLTINLRVGYILRGNDPSYTVLLRLRSSWTSMGTTAA